MRQTVLPAILALVGGVFGGSLVGSSVAGVAGKPGEVVATQIKLVGPDGIEYGLVGLLDGRHPALVFTKGGASVVLGMSDEGRGHLTLIQPDKSHGSLTSYPAPLPSQGPSFGLTFGRGNEPELELVLSEGSLGRLLLVDSKSGIVWSAPTK